MKKNKLFLSFFIFILIFLINVNIDIKKEKKGLTNNSLKWLSMKSIALAEEGVPSCYSSTTFNPPFMMDYHWVVAWGERCYLNGEECGQEADCRKENGNGSDGCHDQLC